MRHWDFTWVNMKENGAGKKEMNKKWVEKEGVCKMRCSTNLTQIWATIRVLKWLPWGHIVKWNMQKVLLMCCYYGSSLSPDGSRGLKQQWPRPAPLHTVHCRFFVPSYPESLHLHMWEFIWWSVLNETCGKPVSSFSIDECAFLILATQQIHVCFAVTVACLFGIPNEYLSWDQRAWWAADRGLYCDTCSAFISDSISFLPFNLFVDLVVFVVVDSVEKETIPNRKRPDDFCAVC